MNTTAIILSQFLALNLVACAGSSAGVQSVEKTFSSLDCPTLAGNYTSADGDRRLTITEKKTSSDYRIVIGEGAEELQIDEMAHSLPQGGNYLGTCKSRALELEVTGGGQKAVIRYYFNSNDQLVEEEAGSITETTLWNRE